MDAALSNIGYVFISGSKASTALENIK